MQKAMIRGNEIRCPVCGRKVAEITGHEVIKNFVFRCPKKINGISHDFVIDLSDGGDTK